MVHWQWKDVLHIQPIACCQFIFSFNDINTKTKINPQQKLPDSSSIAVQRTNSGNHGGVFGNTIDSR